jgi:hypothetical protein
MAHGDIEFELESDRSSKSACWLKSEISLNFPASSPGEHFGKRHESSARVGSHGEAALERSSTISSAHPGPEDEGVSAVESDGWLNGD